MKKFIIGLAVGLVALGAVASAMASPAPKVTVCHHGSEIEVSENAVSGHLGHGDTLGACVVTPPVDPPVDPPVNPPLDVCVNIDGAQATVPDGYFAIFGWCFERATPPVDPVDPPVVIPPVVTQPAVLVAPERCSDGLPPDAGKDGWVSALGNSNDQCDHSGDPRLNNGVDTRTRW